MEETSELVSFLLVSGVYGAIHALAWDSTFPNETETTLWRVASLLVVGPAAVTLAVGGSLLALVGIMLAINKWMLKARFSGTEPRRGVKLRPKGLADHDGGCLGALLGRICQLACFLFVLGLYLPARVYLVWESFRTLLCLPPEVFEATEWSQYLPHIT